MAEIIPKAAPNLNLPPGEVCCDIAIIDTTTDLVCSTTSLLEPEIKGHELLNLPTYAFHIKNQKTGVEVMFDLGARKDWWNAPPVVVEAMEKTVPGIRITQGVDDILKSGGVSLENISAVILSHWHWDHIGDMSKFGPQTALVVGPGFKKALLPGYPAQEDAVILQSDVEGRPLREIDFSNAPLIGRFHVFDYFGDGSLYVLDAPGHAVGHICCLVRDTPTTFVFLGGDVTHFGGAFRPSPYIPLPSQVPESTILDAGIPAPCPCHFFTSCHPLMTESTSNAEDSELTAAARVTPFYHPSAAPGSWYLNPALAAASINKVGELDADPNILVVLAHDPDSKKYLPFFPHGKLNNWKTQKSLDGNTTGLKEGVHWSWLNELPRNGKPGRQRLVEGRLGKPGSAI